MLMTGYLSVFQVSLSRKLAKYKPKAFDVLYGT